ncbi:MAG: hypothetical protein CSB49_08230 [Proteobacteria bacterium]|nr:MAG: hypothetical protein CSB49_08230 [Pseudomonadota bacterium]
MVRRWLSPLFIGFFFLATGCTGSLEISQEDPSDISETGDLEVDGPELTTFSTKIPIGATVKVYNVKVGLNCRTGPSTKYMVKTLLHKGATGKVLSQSSSRKWYKLNIVGKRCWAYHYYLKQVSGSSGQSVNPGGGSCHSGAKFGWVYCSASCPCGEGEGDCDSDSECKSGLVCAKDVGSSYGVRSTVDVCQRVSGGTPPTPPPAANPNGFSGMTSSYVLSRNGIINAAKAFVGFSYWWGGAKLPKPWQTSGKTRGACHKSGGHYSHSGSWGADCSGFVGDVWQLPEHRSFESNAHPFTTYSFRYSTTHWRNINRSSCLRGDALVYRGSSGGHIVIYAGGDAWGAVKTYEARGCSYGIVYNTRTLSTSYKGRRRKGL